MPFPDRKKVVEQDNVYGTQSGVPSTVKQPTNFELFQQQMGKRLKYFNESETHSASYAGNLGAQG